MFALKLACNCLILDVFVPENLLSYNKLIRAKENFYKENAVYAQYQKEKNKLPQRVKNFPNAKHIIFYPYNNQEDNNVIKKKTAYI